MKPGKKFKKSIRKFIQRRVYIWDLIYLKEGEKLSDDTQKTIVARFVQNSFVGEYKGNDNQQVSIIDNLEGRASLYQIYQKFRQVGSVEAFLIARELSKRPEYKIRIGTYLKELR